ncbi:MAG: hypothetical protein IJ949_00525 [Oscillospiraceae bacterium]|nr:hypothetical protein [Oscillospiraceae bacterium]
MDITRAKEIVSTLAEGVDPTTGEILPTDHVCNNVEVVRAFYALLQQEMPASKKKMPENSGKKCTEEDDELLKELFERGMKRSQLQKTFMRSRASIEARLVKLGLIEERFRFWRR